MLGLSLFSGLGWSWPSAVTTALNRRPANPLERGFAALTVLFALIAPWCHGSAARKKNHHFGTSHWMGMCGGIE